jgi:transposase-like protein
VKTYSESFKDELVQRMLHPGAPSANKVSLEVGIGQPTLPRWLRGATTLATVSKRRKPSVPTSIETAPSG